MPRAFSLTKSILQGKRWKFAPSGEGVSSTPIPMRFSVLLKRWEKLRNSCEVHSPGIKDWDFIILPKGLPVPHPTTAPTRGLQYNCRLQLKLLQSIDSLQSPLFVEAKVNTWDKNKVIEGIWSLWHLLLQKIIDSHLSQMNTKSYTTYLNSYYLIYHAWWFSQFELL